MFQVLTDKFMIYKTNTVDNNLISCTSETWLKARNQYMLQNLESAGA